MRKIAKIFGIIILILIIAIVGIAAYVKFALPNVGAAPNITIEKTPERIKRGEYLANHVTVCMDCHSERDWTRFSAPLVEGTLGRGGERFDKTMGFPGNYYAANITPSGIGDWTDGEVFRAVTTGVRKSGKPIFPVMPHKNYGQLDQEDIYSIIAYVRSLQPIENKVPESNSDFPMNFIINTVPKKAHLTKRPDSSNAVAYGKYLVTAASCGECHTPFEKGSFDMKYFLAGGRNFQMRAGTLSTPNLTPDNETGLGKWSKEQFLNKFKYYRDSAARNQTVDGSSQFNTIMPWTMFAGMTDGDLGAIYDYLHSVQPLSHKITKWTPRPASQTE